MGLDWRAAAADICFLDGLVFSSIGVVLVAHDQVRKIQITGFMFADSFNSAAFFGFSLLSLFISTYGYIMQRYTSVAASALVSNTFTRYVIGGSIVIVSIPMFENLGCPPRVDDLWRDLLRLHSGAATPLPQRQESCAEREAN